MIVLKSRNDNRRKDSSKQAVFVTLPYDFIPFAEAGERCYPYQYSEQGSNLPKHNDDQGLSGTIEYEIEPCSDLAIEVRDKFTGGTFMSGSSIRGKIRSNLEILSAAYPQFVNRTQMLYRDVSNPKYVRRLTTNDGERVHGFLNDSDGSEKKPAVMTRNLGIERTIQVGFLRKKGDRFYVTPAQMFGDKYFVSIKEYRLKQMKLAGKGFSTIYLWKNEDLENIGKIESRILEKTEQIKQQRLRLKEKLVHIQSDMDEVFTKRFALNKIMRKIRNHNDINRIKAELLEALKEDIPAHYFSDMELKQLHEIYQLYADRWGLKVTLNLQLNSHCRDKSKANRKFVPYQRGVYFKRSGSNGIAHISTNFSEETTEKGYLFNSSNASSKRSHYFVLGPNTERDDLYYVPDAVINGYNRNLDKFHGSHENEAGTSSDHSKNKSLKPFYDIFNHFDKIVASSETCDTEDGLIVFFHTAWNPEKGQMEIRGIGRTPYFKIPHRNQLDDLIGAKERNRFDFAEALFGFVPDNQDKENEAGIAYKSRLRFSPVDIHGEIETEIVKDFVLMSPSASASAMYLQQDGGKIKTYEDDNVKLNGYKYYHVLTESIKPKPKDNKYKNIIQHLKVIKANGIRCTGKIDFRNLSEEELGLLLLSVDWREMLASRHYRQWTSAYQDQAENAYELIGSAKSYGLGKVKIKIKGLWLEKKGNDLESLICNPMEPSAEHARYVDKFIAKMGGESYFQKDYFKRYIQSKMEKSFNRSNQGRRQDPKHIHWETMEEELKKSGSKGGGYPTDWRLGRQNP